MGAAEASERLERAQRECEDAKRTYNARLSIGGTQRQRAQAMIATTVSVGPTETTTFGRREATTSLYEGSPKQRWKS